MRLVMVLLGLLLGSALPAGAAVQITSMSPDHAAPGTAVTVTGGPFLPGTTVLLGESEITPKAIQPRRLTFELPTLPPGQYLLRLKKGGTVSLHPLLFRIVEPQPVITAVDPAEFDACVTDPRPLLQVEGRGFLPGATLLIDDVATAVDGVTEHRISLTVPALDPGPHQVVVVNPSGTRSLPRGFLVNGTPEISSAQVGSSDVTTYDLIIEGKNFLSESQLFVNGKRVSVARQVPPGQDSATFTNCHTIVYHRHPFSTQPQHLGLQVVNPGGFQSSVTYVDAP